MNAEQWCNLHGGRFVHSSWRDGMVNQGRAVKPENRLEWKTLEEADRELDIYIALEVIGHFLNAVRSGIVTLPENLVDTSNFHPATQAAILNALPDLRKKD